MPDFTPKMITSRSNPRIVDAAKLQEKKHRNKTERFFFEGHKLFSEARETQVPIECVIVEEQAFEKYAELFPSKTGMPAKPLRMALGSLLIQKQYGYSDEELVEQLRENPYYQYCIGMPGYEDK